MKQLKISILSFICFYASVANAQQEQTMHFMRETWQSNLTNPALLPEDQRIHISLPSFYYSVNSPVLLGSLIVDRGKKRYLSLSGGTWIDKLESRNFLETNAQLQTLAISMPITKSKNLRLNLHHQFASNTSAEFGKDLFAVAFRGNAEYIGKTANLDNRLDASIYSEFGAGITYQINNVSLGFRVKRLNGVAGAFTEANQIRLTTDDGNYGLTLNTDYLLRTFIPKRDEIDRFLIRNGGYAFDLGVSAKIQRLQIAAAVNDLSANIRWKTSEKSYLSKGIEKFDGFSKFDPDSLTYRELLDTLQTQFNVQKLQRGVYTQYLPQRAYISATYQLTDYIRVGGLFYSEFRDQEVRYGVTLDANLNVNNYFNIGASYSLRNEDPQNLGLHASLRYFKRAQFYFVTDNVWSYIRPSESSMFNARFGCNITLDEIKDERQLRREKKQKERREQQKSKKENVKKGKAAPKKKKGFF